MSWNSQALSDFRNYRATTPNPVTGPNLGFSSRVLSGGQNPQFQGAAGAFNGVLSNGGSFQDSDYGSLSGFGVRGAAAPVQGGAPAAPGFGLVRPDIEPPADPSPGFGFEQASGGQIDLMRPLGGWQKAGIGMQGLSSLTNAYMGMKQYGLAKKQFGFQKRAYEDNYRNQVADHNRELEDRQRRRALERPEQAMSVADYMARYGAR